MLTHKYKNTNLYATPKAEPRGILLINSIVNHFYFKRVIVTILSDSLNNKNFNKFIITLKQRIYQYLAI